MIGYVNPADPSAGFLKLNSTCPDKPFEKNFFRQNINFCHQFWILARNFCAWQEKFSKEWRWFFSLGFNHKIWCFVVVLFITSGQWDKNFSVFRQNNSDSFVETCILLVPTEFFLKKTLFWRNTLFYHIGILVEYFCVHRWKMIDSVAKTTCYVSMQSVEEIGYFWTVCGLFSQISGFKPKEVRLLANSFWQDFQNYILRIQLFIFRKDIFLEE